MTTNVNDSRRITCRCPTSFEASIVEVGTLVGSVVVPFPIREDDVTAAVLLTELADEEVPVDGAEAEGAIFTDATLVEITSEEPETACKMKLVGLG